VLKRSCWFKYSWIDQVLRRHHLYSRLLKLLRLKLRLSLKVLRVFVHAFIFKKFFFFLFQDSFNLLPLCLYFALFVSQRSACSLGAKFRHKTIGLTYVRLDSILRHVVHFFKKVCVILFHFTVLSFLHLMF
jgi:hypothetical protein